MAYLMHIAFDNSSRLAKDIYYFEYKTVRYKLIQNRVRKWSDVLITIVGDRKSRISQEVAYSTAGEFLSALSWANRARIDFQNGGGPGIPDGYTLKKARCRSFTFPRIPFGGYNVGHYIDVIPKIETEPQKIALALFREAFSSNKHYLSFLFYWHILETGKTSAIGWIDKTNKLHVQGKANFYLERDYMRYLSLGDRSLGQYLYDDCRNAIAHVKRQSGKPSLKFDDLKEDTRIATSAKVLESFARYYISHELQLNKSLYLIRKNKRGFPFYADDEHIKKYGGVGAYPPVPLSKLRKKKW